MLLIFFARSRSLSLFMLVISIMATSKIWANHKKSDVTIASSVFKSKTIEASFWCLFWWHWLFMCDTSWLSSSNSSALVSQKKPTQFDDLISAGVQNGMKTHTHQKKCLKIHSTQSADTIASNQTTTTKMKEANEEKRNTKIVKNKQSETEYVYTTQE